MSRPAPNPEYRRFHPKWYRQQLPIFWWLKRRAYTKFISRELTSVLVAYAALLLLFQMWALAAGAETYAHLQRHLAEPWVVGFHVLVLLGLLFHTITWLNLAPRALVVHLGRKRVPARLVLVGHYAAWAGVSAALAWLLIGGR